MPSISTLFISLTQLSGSCQNVHLQGLLRQHTSSLSLLHNYTYGSSTPSLCRILILCFQSS